MLALAVKKAEVQDLAETALSNAEYEKKAPRESAICYRLYAAAILIAPQDEPMAKAKNALPWISRAIEVDPKVQDMGGLAEAASFVGRIAEGAMAQAALDEFFYNVFRIGMVEATDEEVTSQTKGMIEGVKAMMSPQ